jgi:phosphatidylserine decarboxylase
VTIAREGWPVIAAAAGVLGVVGVVGALAGHLPALLPLVVGVGFCVWFFRDPERSAPADERLVVSPADGRVVAVVEEREEHFLHAPATRISIFMSPLDVHVNRNPVSGTVELVRHTSGKFRAAFKDKASLDNERNAVVLTSGGRRYLMVQIAGALARRIVCHLTPGVAVRRGERFGMIMFGSRVDLFLPPGVTPVVRNGARVHAGTSVLAEVSAAPGSGG